MSTVQNLFQTRQEVVTDTLTLCTVKIPLPNAPLVSVVMKLNLNIYATGKAELAFVQNHVVGVIGLVDRDGKTHGIFRELGHRIDDTAIIFPIFPRGQYKQSIT